MATKTCLGLKLPELNDGWERLQQKSEYSWFVGTKGTFCMGIKDGWMLLVMNESKMFKLRGDIFTRGNLSGKSRR